MRIRQADLPFRLPGSDSPLKKSTSVTAIIHGAESKPNNLYYVDSLERFRRDYATVDKSDRDEKRQREDAYRTRRRMQSMDRELSFKRIDEGNLEKLKQRQSHSQQIHQMGSKMNIHSHGVPIDPVSQSYQNTENGRRHQNLDEERRLNTLTCGTSGYNIINGQASMPVQQMMRADQLPIFQQKLSQYYEKFRIRPTDN